MILWLTSRCQRRVGIRLAPIDAAFDHLGRNRRAAAHGVPQNRAQQGQTLPIGVLIPCQHLLPDPRQVREQVAVPHVLQQDLKVFQVAMPARLAVRVPLPARLHSVGVGVRQLVRQRLEAREHERTLTNVVDVEELPVEQVQQVRRHAFRPAAGQEEAEEALVPRALRGRRLCSLPCRSCPPIGLHDSDRVASHIPHEKALEQRFLHPRSPRKGVNVVGGCRVGVANEVHEGVDFLVVELFQAPDDRGDSVLAEVGDGQGEEDAEGQLVGRGEELVDEGVALGGAEPQHGPQRRVAHHLRSRRREHQVDGARAVPRVHALGLQQVPEHRPVALVQQPLGELGLPRRLLLRLLGGEATRHPRLLAAVGEERELLVAVQPVPVVAAAHAQPCQQRVGHLVPPRRVLLLLLHAVARLHQALPRRRVLVQQPEQPLHIPQDRACKQRQELGQDKSVRGGIEVQQQRLSGDGEGGVLEELLDSLELDWNASLGEPLERALVFESGHAVVGERGDVDGVPPALRQQLELRHALAQQPLQQFRVRFRHFQPLLPPHQLPAAAPQLWRVLRQQIHHCRRFLRHALRRLPVLQQQVFRPPAEKRACELAPELPEQVQQILGRRRLQEREHHPLAGLAEAPVHRVLDHSAVHASVFGLGSDHSLRLQRALELGQHRVALHVACAGLPCPSLQLLPELCAAAVDALGFAPLRPQARPRFELALQQQSHLLHQRPGLNLVFGSRACALRSVGNPTYREQL
mmetsp:Transcript_64213/g.151159  ORF Transcript_64213/g.151159 Transcript_64213/m.151159 type:complete len:748 (-) Transcript_64213:920-3163(-)